MPSTLEAELEQAISSLGLSADLIARVDPDQAAQIMQEARARFVSGNPRAWWLSLRVPYQIREQDDSPGTLSLMRHWASEDPFCWFIPELEDASTLVYKTSIPVVERLLAECSFFEYYLLNQKLNHLLIENDHNQIIIAEYESN